MTTPSRWVVGVLCALAGCGGGVLGGGDVGPARWEVRADPGPTDDVLRILVEEVACASGQPATGRIDVDVDERDDSIELDVRVRARPGDQTCPGNPRTPFVVRLDSPVGDRTVEGARRGIDSADDTTAAVRVVLDPPRSIPEIASEREVSLGSWVELRCDGPDGPDEGFAPTYEPVGEYSSELESVGAAIDQLGLPNDGWHVLRLPTPWLGGSSWWLQFRDGTPVVQINADRRVLGWRAFGTACAGLPVGWTPGDALGEVEHLDHRAVAGRLDVADLFADVDGLTPTADGWMFEEVDRCPAWTVLEDAVIDAGATITFTSWYGDWPGGAGEVPVEAVMGIALDGRGVMLTTARDGLRADAIAADLVWEDESSPLPCRLDSTFTAQVVEP